MKLDPPDPPGSVAVSYVDVDEDLPVDRLLGLLSADEAARAHRLRSRPHRQEFVAAHALLRSCLHRLTGRHDWTMRHNAYGKPEVELPSPFRPVTFSLSHTSRLVACAISLRDEVGIDAEAWDRDTDAMSVATAFFSEDECQGLARLRQEDLAHAFTVLWTFKEAVVKAMGQGLSVPLGDFTVSPSGPTVTFKKHLGQNSDRWSLDSLVLPGHHLALAINRAHRHITPARVTWQRVPMAELLTLPAR